MEMPMKQFWYKTAIGKSELDELMPSVEHCKRTTLLLFCASCDKLVAAIKVADDQTVSLAA
jgi:hypothetical protein